MLQPSTLNRDSDSACTPRVPMALAVSDTVSGLVAAQAQAQRGRGVLKTPRTKVELASPSLYICSSVLQFYLPLESCISVSVSLLISLSTASISIFFCILLCTVMSASLVCLLLQPGHRPGLVAPGDLQVQNTPRAQQLQESLLDAGCSHIA